MSGPESLRFTVGHGDWIHEARSFTDQFDPNFWDGLDPCCKEEIVACERAINRELPGDFREFLLRFGAGNFGYGGGGIYTPEEIVLACPGPFYTLLDSSGWATDEEQRHFYATRGAENPRPDLFTAGAMTFEGVNLLDLLQVGNDGQGCYHQLYLAKPPRPFGYCLLDADGSIEDRLPSFSDGLKHILTLAWRSANGLDQAVGLRLDISELRLDN